MVDFQKISVDYGNTHDTSQTNWCYIGTYVTLSLPNIKKHFARLFPLHSCIVQKLLAIGCFSSMDNGASFYRKHYRSPTSKKHFARLFPLHSCIVQKLLAIGCFSSVDNAHKNCTADLLVPLIMELISTVMLFTDCFFCDDGTVDTYHKFEEVDDCLSPLNRYLLST